MGLRSAAFVIPLMCFFALGTSVSAHAAEQGFVLLLPTTFYITSGTLAVVGSLVLVTLLRPQATTSLFKPIACGQGWPLSFAQMICNILSSTTVFALIIIGILGPTDPQENLLPLTIWTVWWIALVAVQGSLGDVWRWIHPWRGLYDLIFPSEKAPFNLPSWLGVWPAVCTLIAFNVFAIADIAPSDPQRLATVVLGYWVFTFTGMIAFGPVAWLGQVEFISVFFRLLSQLAPLRWGRTVHAGTPGWQLLTDLHRNLGVAVFCISLLALGSFDGLHETFWWLGQININPLAFPGRSAVIWTSTIGLVAACVLLVAVFATAVWVGHALTRGTDFRTLFCSMAVTLLPIALGYHIAHFLVTFLVQIQYVAAALCSLFGVAPPAIATGFLATPSTVKTIFLTQAGVVVVSHVLSVLMAHHVAHRMFSGRRQIILGQSGIAILMIAYTVFGLWLLASPRGV